ncbi:hypothetical protein GCM10009776_34360 [Microbacterium deminutum]|uniref:DUF3040 domain-containing protein n=1 Tax=Microbacterium deminutum TaxID=344164 RepID=A0ABN2RGS7_9MICO
MATPSSDNTAEVAGPSSEAASQAANAAWQRQLPMRFNPPPGWPIPSRAWILQHMGRGMSDAWKPVDAPPDPPVDWPWWVRQEPAWTAWIEREKRSFRGLPWLVAALVASPVVIVLLLPLTGATVVATFAALALACGVMVIATRRSQFRRDPVARFREQHRDEWMPILNESDSDPGDQGGCRRARRMGGDVT